MSKPWEISYADDHEGRNGGDVSETSPLVPKGDSDRTARNCDICGLWSWLSELHQTFGYRLLWLLFSVEHLAKGFVFDFQHRANPYLWKLYHVPAPQAQVFISVAYLPWAMKPIVGLISDLVPVCGYSKAPYMVFTTVLGTVALACLGFTTELTPVRIAVICVFLVTLMISTCDLLVEAKYSERIKTHSYAGPSLLSYVWGGMQFFAIVAIACSGPAVKLLGVRWMYLICIIPAASMLLPICLGYIEEQRLSDQQIADKRKCFVEHQELCWLSVLMFAATTCMTCAGVCIQDPLANAAVAVSVGLVVLVSFSVTLSPAIAKFNAFTLIQSACMLTPTSAAFYFYTDSEEQYPATKTSPGGPHFSMMFFNSGIGTAGAVCSLLGIWIYKQYLSKWKYRTVMVATNIVFSILSCLDLVVYSRVNLDWGIPDELFVLGAQSFENVIKAWIWMPQVVILSYMCPKDMEATMYALLSGCHNLGWAIAGSCGALLLDRLGCHPKGAVGETHEFDNLWKAAAVAIVMPLLCICLLFWLIPNTSQTENFTSEVEDSATIGSMWKQWMASWNKASI